MDASDDLGYLVLPRDATRPLELTAALAAWVPPQSVSGLVRALDRARDLNVSHLKRVHRGAIRPDDQATGQGEQQPPTQKGQQRIAVLLCIGGTDSLSAEVIGLLSACSSKPLAIQVPAHAPLTREQFDAYTSAWPVHFHPAAAMRNLAIFNEPLTDHERTSVPIYMRRAIALAERNAAAGGRAIAAVVVRRSGTADGDRGAGSEDRAIAACADACWPVEGDGARASHPQSHPLQHAVMRCIDEVARLERAAAAAKSARTQPLDVDPPGEEGAGSVDGAATAAPVPPEHHLCAGCDVYVTHEPCAMCAMALVHSRVRRVIYALPAAGGGALGSRYMLHTERSVNHHFSVVRGALHAEAARVESLASTAAACACVGG